MSARRHANKLGHLRLGCARAELTVVPCGCALWHTSPVTRPMRGVHRCGTPATYSCKNLYASSYHLSSYLVGLSIVGRDVALCFRSRFYTTVVSSRDAPSRRPVAGLVRDHRDPGQTAGCSTSSGTRSREPPLPHSEPPRASTDGRGTASVHRSTL
jgi:hypothetical protein